MSLKAEFYAVVKSEFAPRLREAGFKGSGQNYRRVQGDVINAINIQGDRWGGRCVLNIGLHATFLPSHNNELPDAKTIKEIDCEFRGRINWPEETNSWWEYGDSPSAANRSARNLIAAFWSLGEPRFRRYNSVESLAAMYPTEAVERNDRDFSATAFGYLPCTVARIALAMARIHKRLGNDELAQRFAKKGLAEVGGGVALIPYFRAIIDACDAPGAI